jgi:hypothetical protein
MKIMILTPALADSACGTYARSLSDTRVLLARRGVETDVLSVSVPYLCEGRNTLTQLFLNSGADAALWVDSDVGWRAQDIVAILDVAETGVDFLGLPVALKFEPDWEQARRVALAGGTVVDMQVASSRVSVHFLPEDIRDGRFVGAVQTIAGHRVVRVRDVATGVLFMTRAAVERLVAGVPRYSALGLVKPQLFDTPVVDGSLRGEDYALCDRWRALGEEVLVLVDAKTSHVGPRVWQSHFAEQFDRLVRGGNGR